MTRLPLLLLGLLAAGLAGMIAVQLDGLVAPALPSLAAPRRAPVTAPSAQAVPERRPDWIASSLARPLFSPDRRPAVVATGADAPVAAPPRLTGILITPAGRRAVFAGEARSLVVPEGSSIGLFRVQTIDFDHVVVAGPAGEQLLRPSFSPAGADGRETASDRAPEGSAAAFAANPTPSGLDILRNAARLDTAAGVPAPQPGAPEPGVDAIAAGRAPTASRPGPPAGRTGAIPTR